MIYFQDHLLKHLYQPNQITICLNKNISLETLHLLNILTRKYSFFKHQQLLLFQEHKSSENTIFSFQQSHLHNHLIHFLFSLLSASEITISLRYLIQILFF